MKRNLKVIIILTLLTFARTSIALSAEQVYFYYNDPAGTPLAMSDASGTVVWRADYLPFGEESIDLATVQNNKMFVGKEKDSESGLYYFGVRYFDSQSGRFNSPDSIGAIDHATGKINEKMLHDPQRLNLYAYGLNNPYKYIDADGRDIAVIVGSPAGKNIAGHVAAAVTGSGIYSYGTKEDLGTSAMQYLMKQSAYRDSTVYILPTSTAQDDAFIAAFKKDRALATSWLLNNCVDMVADGLKAAGLLKASAAETTPGLMNGYMLLREDEGKVSYQIDIDKGNKDWGGIGQVMSQFEPVQSGQ